MSADRIPSLDGLRGIAAIAVMFFHFAIFFVPQANLFAVPCIDRAYLAVDLFFLLSGFVMAHVYGIRLDWRRFALARFARVYPLFALTLLATIVGHSLAGAVPPQVSFSSGTLALQPLLLQQWAAGLSWDYPSWSISTEAEAYVFFVFAASTLLFERYPRAIAVGCIVTVVALSFHNDGRLNVFVGFSSLARTIAEFSLGVLLYRAHKVAPLPRLLAGLFALVLVGAGLLTHQDFFVVGGLACLIYYTAEARDAFGRLLNSRPAVALGNWSYGVYLWHVPVHLAVMGAYPVGELSMWESRLLALVVAVLVVGLSKISYEYFERPMRRLIFRG